MGMDGRKMLIPLREVLGRHAPLERIEWNRSVGDAVRVMIERDYSQLPVVDEVGDYLGVISEQSIVRRLFHTTGYKALLDLTVDHCLMPAETLSPSDDLFKALDLLKRSSAVIVIEDRKPSGILTHADTTDFFRDFSEGLMIVRAIEIKLKQYIESYFPDEESQRNAIQAAVKPQSERRERPVSSVDSLTLGEIIGVISCKENWSKFEVPLQPKPLFLGLIEPVREARNHLAHFRNEEVQAVELDALRAAQTWLESRPKRVLPESASIPVEVSEQTIRNIEDPRLIYSNFVLLLLHNDDVADIRLTLNETVQLFPDRSAFSDPLDVTDWDNSLRNNPLALSWLAAGRRVTETDAAKQYIVFSKLWFSPFEDVRDYSERAASLRSGLIPPIAFASSYPGLHFCWWLNVGTLRVELRIDTGNREQDEEISSSLQQQIDAISVEVGYITEVQDPASADYDEEGDQQFERLVESGENDENEENEYREPRRRYNDAYADNYYNEDLYDYSIGDEGTSMHVIIPDKPIRIYINANDGGSHAPDLRTRWAVETMLKFVHSFEERIKELTL
jgi:predicted transcriptional regulator